jgi:p-cumate 2,3-dioxygenase beta subunit
VSLRAEVEDFLYREAALLDEWRLEEWMALFTDDGTYLVPPADAPDADPARTPFLVNDDRFRLGERARRLLTPRADADSPHPRTQHTISNVRVTQGAEGSLRVDCHFIVYRARREVMEVFPGQSAYGLVRANGSLRIRCKRAMLTPGALRPQRKLSFIL